jgi:hypothetical protein
MCGAAKLVPMLLYEMSVPVADAVLVRMGLALSPPGAVYARVGPVLLYEARVPLRVVAPMDRTPWQFPGK